MWISKREWEQWEDYNKRTRDYVYELQKDIEELRPKIRKLIDTAELPPQSPGGWPIGFAKKELTAIEALDLIAEHLGITFEYEPKSGDRVVLKKKPAKRKGK